MISALSWRWKLHKAVAANPRLRLEQQQKIEFEHSCSNRFCSFLCDDACGCRMFVERLENVAEFVSFFQPLPVCSPKISEVRAPNRGGPRLCSDSARGMQEDRRSCTSSDRGVVPLYLEGNIRENKTNDKQSYMYMYVYICIFVYVYMYMYKCICIYVCICTYMHLCICICVCICKYICKYIFICICACMYVCTYVRTYVCMLVCMYVCLYVCVYVWLYVCMYVCLYVCMYVCLYVCLYVCMYVIACNCM